MNTKLHSTLRPLSALLALSLAAAPTAHADERESLETLKQTTLGLIDALVESGALTRAKADAMLKQARERAAQAAPAASAAPGAPTAKADNTIRVQYVPQAVKDQIRNELKEEVVAQAKAERWGVPNAAAEWTDRLRFSGDVRLRAQLDKLDSGNAVPLQYVSQASSDRVSRGGDLVDLAANTTEDRSRLRLRARLGLNAKVSDQVSAGLRLATGSSTDRVSTNQTLGQGFNKYAISVDQAYLRAEPFPWLSISGGRIPNPWFSTDLVWDENLNFEGVAATLKWPHGEADVQPFATLGAFPVREDSPPQRNDRWLYGAQLGMNWQATLRTRIKLGLAYYHYQNFEGRIDPAYTTAGGAGLSLGQYEYPKGLRQKGNTLIDTMNDDAIAANLAFAGGLAYKFRPLVLTAAAEFAYFNPYSLLVSAEYINNTGYSTSEMAGRYRAGLSDTDWANITGFAASGRKDGYLLRAAFGHADVHEQGDWQASLTWRWLGSDATLDAFTSGDFGLGGTNNRGTVVGFNYGLDRNTVLGLRYMSARSIDSTTVVDPNAKFSVDSLQVDLNVRF